MLTGKADLAVCSPAIGVSGIVLECVFNFKQISVIMLGFGKSSYIYMHVIMLMDTCMHITYNNILTYAVLLEHFNKYNILTFIRN